LNKKLTKTLSQQTCWVWWCITVAGRRIRRKTDRLCSDNEAGGRTGEAEIKLKELKHEEGHTALGE
jgi:hypothetical protein